MKQAVPLDVRLDVFEVLLGACQEAIHLFVRSGQDGALEVLDCLEGDYLASGLVVGLELLEGGLVAEGQELLDQRFGSKLGDLKQLVEEHLQDHHPLAQVLVVVPPELSLLGNGRHRQSRVQPLQCRLQPLEVRVPSLHCFTQTVGRNKVAHVALLKDASLLLLELSHTDTQVLGLQEGTGSDGRALNHLAE